MKFELDNVELYFKNTPILNSVYLTAETGKITAILGRNGCGKSSLMDIAFGNLNPKYKLIRLDNKPLLEPLYKTGLAMYLPQYDFVSKELKVGFVFNLFQLDWHDFSKDFPLFSKYENSKFKTLSNGERRLVELYLCLRSKGKIVLLDEPFSYLSPLHIERIQALIMEEKKEKAIILSDHMYQHIIAVSDSLYLLTNGSTKLIDNLETLEAYKYLNPGAAINYQYPPS